MKNTFLIAVMLAFGCLTIVGCTEDPGENQDPPTVEITEPTEGATLNVTRVRVRGRASNTKEITVNGTPVSVVGGAWEVPVDVGEGDVSVEAVVKGVSDKVNFKVDASAPKLELIAPQRGVMHDSAEGDTITVKGKASDDGLGLTLVKVDETIVELDADGMFSYDYPLEVGLNTIKITALDNAQNETQHIVGVIHGPMTDPTSKIEPGFNIFAQSSTVATAMDVLETVLTPELVKSIIDTQFANNEQVTINSVSFDPVEIEAIPRSDPGNAKAEGFIEFTLKVKNVKMDGVFKIAGQNIELEVGVDEATIETEMYLRADGRGGIEIEFGEARLDLPKESLSWKVKVGNAELNDDDVRVLGDIVENVARLAFSELLSEQILNELYDPAILNRRIELLGRTLEFTLYIEEIIVRDTGVFVRTSLDMPADKFAEIPDVVGALNRTAGPSSAPMLASDATVTTGRTSLDRLLHGIWRSGLLNQTLAGDAFAGFELPFELNAGALALLLDGRITNRADADSPIGIKLRPMLPPIVELVPGTEGSGIKIQMPELHIDLMLNMDTAPEKLVTISTFLELTLSLSVEGTQVGVSFETSLLADVADEPLFDLNDKQTEELLVELVKLVPQIISNQLVLNGEADLTWVKLTNPEIELHGLEKDQVTVGLDVEANPGGVNP